MPVITINDLPSIPSLADNDVIPIVGVSANTTYKVTKQDLLNTVFPYTGSAIITGSLQVIGPITADVLRVSIISSSVIYSSGSNIFGDSTSDKQQMTGSVTITGSISVTGPSTLGVLSATNATILTMQGGGNAKHVFSAGASGEARIRTANNINLTLGVNEDAITIENGGNTGFGISDPSYKIDVAGSAPIRLGGDITDATDISFRVGGNSTYRYLNLLNDGGASGLRAGGLLVSDTYAYANPTGGNVVIQKSLAVGLTTPSATTGRIDVSNDVVAFSTSDINYKKNISNIQNALEKVKQINGVEFDWIENPEIHGNSGHDVGVIAQEIEKVIPEVVTTRENGIKAVKYEKIVSLLIEAIKDLEKQVEELKNK